MGSCLYVLVQLLLDLLATRRLSDQQKDLEILLLRHHLRILQRKFPRSPRIARRASGQFGGDFSDATIKEGICRCRLGQKSDSFESKPTDDMG